MFIKLKDCSFDVSRLQALQDCPGDAYGTLIILEGRAEITTMEKRKDIEKAIESMM